MNIDRHSQTWVEIERWLNDRRDNRVRSLINGSAHDDRYRGEIRLIDDLLTDAAGDTGKAPDNLSIDY